MTPQSEFISEAFHTLAQPIAALRVTVELGLREDAGKPARQVLEDCLRLTDHLMQDMAVLREIASLAEAPQLESCDGEALLQASVEEMAPVAEASGVALQFDAEPAFILCHAPMLERALFVLMDGMIAHAECNRKISISLHRCEGGFMLGIPSGAPQGQRQKLCCKLMQFAGGSTTGSATGGIFVIFRESSHREFPAIAIADEQLLTLN
jgi:K+-sensing histidine kinase KdpD